MNLEVLCGAFIGKYFWLAVAEGLDVVTICRSVIFGCVETTDSGLRISIVTDGTYSISVNDKKWLESTPTFFVADGSTHTAGYNMKLLQSSATSGYDRFGEWQSTEFHYLAGSSNITASIKTYTYSEDSFIIFSQKYTSGARNTRCYDDDLVIGGFPGFAGSPNNTLYYLSYGGIMVGDTSKKFGIWSKNISVVNSGIASGPLAIFDTEGNTIVMSPFSQFMSSSMLYRFGNVTWGIMGGVDSVPAGFQYDTILFYAKGINKAFQGWGRVLREWYSRSEEFIETDLTISHLGYWTDNGAYYYYTTEPNKTYEDTMIDVKKYADANKIPYRYMQYDSWWYYKGNKDGVKTWEPRPDVFPSGLKSLREKIGLPLALHNRYWSNDTTYAVQNRGRYLFQKESNSYISAPLTQNFWIDILGKGQQAWGLVLYEQDWLNVEFAGMRHFLSSTWSGRLWLLQMADAAKVLKMPIQYCMSNSRHALQTLELDTVTQARVSGDYHPGGSQWRIGVSSIFAYALGLRPFKDTFWTTETQPGNKYASTEPYAALNTVVSVLSTGPVGPSDRIGYTNVSLLMRCCNADGKILKPSKPATAIDRQIIMTATMFSTSEIWTTYSEIVVGAETKLFGILLAAAVDSVNQKIDATDLEFMGNDYMYYEYRSPQNVLVFDHSKALSLANCTAKDFCLYHFLPRISFGTHNLYFLGEQGKWVPVSSQRIKTVTVIEDKEVVFTVDGVKGENVTLAYILDGSTYSVTCVFETTSDLLLFVMGKRC